ncbi:MULTISPECIES: hypothetical protein [Halorhodospira]|uniref:hypothetical protein n=1 Tax=Halorhodospira TaxID=85108 RepID=UPI001EE918FB|nr:MULTISPECIES: hypothetical protein [Halorhodospira]MCG5526882.1 hypothetical protein [Halorhodospira halophila]MCG5542781.1 hypothetical protein [Halorhodospira sp. 9628]
MKKLLIGMALAFAVTATQASEDCEAVHEFAFQVMKERQVGQTITSVIGQLPRAVDPSVWGLMTMIVYEAYEMPRNLSPDYQRAAATEFAANWYLNCIRVTEPGALPGTTY